MIECCGKDRSTPFCPMCGNDLWAQRPLGSLLRHVTKRADTQAKELEECRAAKSAKPYTVKIAENKLKKWAGWRDALQEVVKNTATEATP